MVKKLLIGIVIFLLVIIFALLGGLYYLKSLLNPSFVVENLESNLNTRAELSELEINLFSILSSIELKGLKLAYRDEIADKGIPLEEREPLKNPLIQLDTVKIGLSIPALISKKIAISEIMVYNPSISLVLFENGGNNLSIMFRPPVLVKGQPNPALSSEVLEKRKKEEEELKKSKQDSMEPKEPFSIHSIPLDLALEKAGIESGNLNINVQKTNQIIKIKGLDFLIKNLDIRPQDLANHNSLDLFFNFELDVIGEGNKESAAFYLTSKGKIQPFVVETGQINPNINYSLTVKKPSYISGFALFDVLAGNHPTLRNFNIKMDKLAQKAELQKDITTNINYNNGRLTFLDSPEFLTSNYSLKINQNTWIQITNNTHQMKGVVLATEEESKRVVQGLDQFLNSRLKGQDTTEIRKQILDKLLDKDRVAIPFSSSGNLKSPTVNLDLSLPSLTDLGKSAAKKAISDAIDKKVPGEAKDALKKFGF